MPLQVKAGWILPLMCVFHITLGAAMSWVACTLIGRKSEIVQKFKASHQLPKPLHRSVFLFRKRSRYLTRWTLYYRFTR